MKKFGFYKLIALLLVFSFAFSNVAPSIAYAQAMSPSPQTTGTGDTEANAVVNEDGELEIDRTSIAPYVSTDNEAYAEIVGKREASIKYYLLSSKRYEAVMFGTPVHYLEDGIYKDIDNSLSLITDKDGKSYYVNTANSFQAMFASALTDGWSAGITKDGYAMKWKLVGTDKDSAVLKTETLTKSQWEALGMGEQRRTLPNLSSAIKYYSAISGTSLQYDLIGDTLKESIILSKAPESNVFVQTVSLEGLILIQNTDLSIVAVDANDPKKEVFYLQAPYAFDSDQDDISNLIVRLEEISGESGLFEGSEKTYKLTYTLDPTWLESANYPVTIDPTVKTQKGSTYDIEDTRIREASPTTNYATSTTLCTGYGSSSHINRSLVYINNLPTIEPGCQIVHASYSLKKNNASSLDSYIAIHEITESWELSGQNGVTWDNKPDFNSNAEDFVKAPDAADAYCKWDITRLAQKWYADLDTEPFGFIIKDMNETANNYKDWYSINNSSTGVIPYCYFVYNNFVGLENYWDFASAGLGRSGAAHVNLYNGSFVYTHNDLSMTGNRMPVSITHVFNGALKSDNDSKMLYGDGWRTNYDQRVSAKVTINTTDYYKYTDGDGTVHYFSYRSSKWQDEDGLGLTMTFAGTYTPTITDKKGNKLVFYAVNDANKPGFLNQLKDSNNNTQTIGYDANHRISQITDGAGRVVLLQRFASGANTGYLEKIREPISGTAYRETTFAYTDTKLTRITYSDDSVGDVERHTDFVYSDGYIDYVTGIGEDANVKKLDFTYVDSKATMMEETSSSGTVLGAKLGISYATGQTTLTQYLDGSQTLTETLQFNDYGNTVCVIGPDGSAKFGAFGVPESDGTIPGSMSKVTDASDLQRFGNNYIKNGSFETSTDWTLAGTSAYTTDTASYLGSKCMQIGSPSGTGDDQFYQSLNLTLGNTYTLSGYIKNTTGTNAKLFIAYYGADNEWHYTYSPTITGNGLQWNRYSVTLTIPNDANGNTVRVGGQFSYTNDTAKFDCLQLEDGALPNQYNIIENADFNNVTSGTPDKWTKGNCTSSDTVVSSTGSLKPGYLSANSFRFVGSPTVGKYVEQTLYIKGNEGDAFTVGGWVKGQSIPIPTGNTTIKFGIAVKFDYVSSTDVWQKIYFSTDVLNWQYLCQKIVAEDNYTSAIIRIEYNYNANAVDFDAIEFYSGGSDNQYDYNANGDISKITYPNGKSESFTYYSGTSNVQYHYFPSGERTSYTYDSYNNVTRIATVTDIGKNYQYDIYGNPTRSRIGGTIDYIENRTAYDDDAQNNNVGNYVDYTTDSFGEVVNYTYDPYRGTLTSVTDPLEKSISNTYDDNTDTLTGTSMSDNGTTISNSYVYTLDRLTQVSHNAPGSNAVTYNLTYNTLGWLTDTYVEEQKIVAYSLEPRTGRVNSITYQNGGTGGNQTINYVYDLYDRVIEVKQGTTTLYSVAYNNKGNVGYLRDDVQSADYYFEYDVLSRTSKVMRIDSAGNWTTSAFTYDATGRVSGFVDNAGTSHTYSSAYAYNYDGNPVSTTLDGGGTVTVTWDNENGEKLGRVTNVTANNNYKMHVGYYDDYTGAICKRTTRIQTLAYYQGTTPIDSLTYTYDERGFITKAQKDANNYSEYLYDAFGQLVRENFMWGTTSYTMIFVYEVGGNITSKTEYAFVAGNGQVGSSIEDAAYSYDSTWRDKLVSFDTEAITYDSIGNPLTYDNWTYTWTQGRKLQQAQNAGTTASYKYNMNGIRTEKTVNNTTTTYNVVGSRVTWEKTGNSILYYYYDANGKVVALRYNDTVYYYVRNAQGDIYRIVDGSGNLQVQYIYDAWGNIRSISGTMADTLGAANPFRYRGYYFDAETGFYYLQSRYYNPQWGRFINADSIAGKIGEINGHNIFIYCKNDPVNRFDPFGMVDGEALETLASGLDYLVTLLALGVSPFGWLIAGAGITGAIIARYAPTYKNPEQTIVYRVHSNTDDNGEYGRSWTGVNPMIVSRETFGRVAGIPEGLPMTYMSVGILFNKEGVMNRPAITIDEKKYGKAWWQEYYIPRPLIVQEHIQIIHTFPLYGW